MPNDIDKRKYIVRQDNFWRLKIQCKGRTYSKNFLFHKYGGISKAFHAAIYHRDKYLQLNGLLPEQQKQKTNKLKEERITICMGINLVKTIKDNGIKTHWEVIYQDSEGDTYKRSILANMDYKSSFLQACNLRYKMCGPLLVVKPFMLPCRPNVPYKVKK